MAVAKSTPLEVLKVLHTLWKGNGINVYQVKTLLKEQYSLDLQVLANGEISAQSLDGKSKYSIK